MTSETDENTQLLREILQELQSIHDLLGSFKNLSPESSDSLSLDATSMDILSLKPGTLKTWKALKKINKGTCTQIAEETGRSFRLESRYLNELHRAGIADKKRQKSEKGATEMVYWLVGSEE